MITKVQGKTVSGELSVKACPRLNPLEKPCQVGRSGPGRPCPDACVGRGLMARIPAPATCNARCAAYLPDMEEVRSARARLQSCDIVYAPVGGHPWREGAFDTVLMQWKGRHRFIGPHAG